jgi:hypothetical protein
MIINIPLPFIHPIINNFLLVLYTFL